jgi:hypothetical protein
VRTIEKVHVFRCTGKIDGLVTYKINVVAGGNRHAERTCALWLAKAHPSLTSVVVQWQCKRVKMDNPIYMEWEDGE